MTNLALVCSNFTTKTTSFWLNTKSKVQNFIHFSISHSHFSLPIPSHSQKAWLSVYMVHYYGPYDCCLLSIFTCYICLTCIIVYSLRSCIIIIFLYIFLVLLVYCQSIMDFVFVMFIFVLFFLLHMLCVCVCIHIYIYIKLTVILSWLLILTSN